MLKLDNREFCTFVQYFCDVLLEVILFQRFVYGHKHLDVQLLYIYILFPERTYLDVILCFIGTSNNSHFYILAYKILQLMIYPAMIVATCT